jgi:hypothetical protein
MTLPAELRILGHDVAVKDTTADDRSERYRGRCCPGDSQVRVDAGMGQDYQLTTMWHEAFHFYCDCLKLEEMDNEALIDRIATFIHATLKDNPDLVDLYKGG